MLFLAGACVCGVVAGVVATLCWRRIMPTGYNRGYWSGFHDHTRRLMATADDREFLRIYKELLASAGRYIGRNLLALVACVAPVGMLAYFALLPLERHAAATAELVEVHSSQPVAIAGAPAAGQSPRSETPRARFVPGGALKLQLAGRELEVGNLQAGTAVCTGAWDCLAMALLGLDVVGAGDLNDALDGHVIVRPVFAYHSPLWPYLTDISVVFYLALVFGALLVSLVRTKGN